MVIKAKKSTNGTSHKAGTVKVKAEAQDRFKAISQQEIEQRIRDRAYFIYLNRGCANNSCAQQDWLEAEKQIKKELRRN